MNAAKTVYRLRLPDDVLHERRSYRTYTHAVIALGAQVRWDSASGEYELLTAKWVVLGFSGSADLAEKHARFARGMNGISDVRVVPVEVAA